MAAKGRLSKAEQAAKAAQNNQYLQRLIEDQDLRASLLAAYGAARNAYGRMSNGTPPHKALLEDRKLQGQLKSAASALKDASTSLREPPRRGRRKGGIGRMLLVLGVGGLLAIAVNEGLRSKVLDMLFGSEEEFDYSASTAPATPAPAPVAGG
jgi:ferric-dicitrate binding protein FerR (iron transport regulator)